MVEGLRGDLGQQQARRLGIAGPRACTLSVAPLGSMRRSPGLEAGRRPRLGERRDRGDVRGDPLGHLRRVAHAVQLHAVVAGVGDARYRHPRLEIGQAAAADERDEARHRHQVEHRLARAVQQPGVLRPRDDGRERAVEVHEDRCVAEARAERRQCVGEAAIGEGHVGRP